ncbi:hypothetical protein [Actinacidiphila yeochonensis]|uniref:hypothetical protein n=1 Tax=Actinacidiphila yeochonensis TaxID=89050 RepID=UPI000ABD386D|nr:hypothetical protein [Actinacidiphila yeochonensis]
MSTDKKTPATSTDTFGGRSAGSGESGGGFGGKSGGKGKGGTYLSIGTSLFSGYTAVKKVRTARAEDDKLRLVDALLRAAVVTTGIVLLVRELRRAETDSLTG